MPHRVVLLSLVLGPDDLPPINILEDIAESHALTKAENFRPCASALVPLMSGKVPVPGPEWKVVLMAFIRVREQRAPAAQHRRYRSQSGSTETRHGLGYDRDALLRIAASGESQSAIDSNVKPTNRVGIDQVVC